MAERLKGQQLGSNNPDNIDSMVAAGMLTEAEGKRKKKALELKKRAKEKAKRNKKPGLIKRLFGGD